MGKLDHSGHLIDESNVTNLTFSAAEYLQLLSEPPAEIIQMSQVVTKYLSLTKFQAFF